MATYSSLVLKISSFQDGDGIANHSEYLVFINEHNLKIDGRWGNLITCVKDFEPCTVCEQGFRSTYTAYFTVIDTRAFVRKDGKEVKNRKVLYPAKGSTIKRIEALRKKYKNLAGLAFKVGRLSGDDPNCGSDFEKLGRVEIAKKFGRDHAKPYSYEKVLEPSSEEELAAIGFGGTVVGSSEDISKEDLVDL